MEKGVHGTLQSGTFHGLGAMVPSPKSIPLSTSTHSSASPKTLISTTSPDFVGLLPVSPSTFYPFDTFPRAPHPLPCRKSILLITPTRLTQVRSNIPFVIIPCCSPQLCLHAWSRGRAFILLDAVSAAHAGCRPSSSHWICCMVWSSPLDKQATSLRDIETQTPFPFAVLLSPIASHNALQSTGKFVH